MMMMVMKTMMENINKSLIAVPWENEPVVLKLTETKSDREVRCSGFIELYSCTALPCITSDTLFTAFQEMLDFP